MVKRPHKNKDGSPSGVAYVANIRKDIGCSKGRQPVRGALFVFKIMKSREQIIKSHINHDDYFATLAMAIDMLARTEESRIKQATLNKKILKKLKADLLFLQKNFKITKK